ncbi:PREDICTED: UPF0587 protein CG4646-like isoform X1 [Nicotiana attenuata]|nr:PREDICTED: UPF0587 protein CG4646-like isoform X1 [Nicotiana attenuata]
MGYFFKMRCENCGNMTGEQCAYLNEMCKLCSREGSVRLIPGSGTAFTALHAERKVWARLMVFECHGLVPEEYNFNGGWMIETDDDPPRLVGANFVNWKFCGIC